MVSGILVLVGSSWRSIPVRWLDHRNGPRRLVRGRCSGGLAAVDPVRHHHGRCGLPDRDALLASVGFAVIFVGAAVLALVWSTRPASAIPAGCGMAWLRCRCRRVAGNSRDVVGLDTLVDEARARPHAGRAAGSDGNRPGRPGARTAVARDRDARARVRPRLDPLRPARGRDRSGPAGQEIARERAGAKPPNRRCRAAARPDRGGRRGRRRSSLVIVRAPTSGGSSSRTCSTPGAQRSSRVARDLAVTEVRPCGSSSRSSQPGPDASP